MKKILLALVLVALASPSWAGSIGLMAAGAEDPMMNSFCTASTTPAACCTGSGTGTCGSITESCTGSGTPFACCSGSGTGSCNAVTLSAPRTQYSGTRHRYIAADFDQTTEERCVIWHFPMPPDYTAAGAMTWNINALRRTGSGGNVKWRVDILCTDGNEDYTTGTFAVNQSQGTADILSANRIGQYTCSGSTCPTTTACSPNDATTVRLCRDQADTGSDNYSVIDLTLNY